MLFRSDSITPNAYEYSISYQSLLEWESHERDMPQTQAELLQHLIKNIDIAVVMLRSEVCNNGRIDLTKLYDILEGMNQQILQAERSSEPVQTARQLAQSEQPIKPNPTKAPLFMRDSYTMESFDSKETKKRELPKKGGFAGIGSYLQKEIDYMRVKNLADNSLEGTVEQDILGYRPPGHMVAQLYDKSDHYTVNVNACLGKTVPDDELWEQCTSYDMKYIDALNGEPQKMLDCVGDCLSDANAKRFYNRFY